MHRVYLKFIGILDRIRQDIYKTIIENHHLLVTAEKSSFLLLCKTIWGTEEVVSALLSRSSLVCCVPVQWRNRPTHEPIRELEREGWKMWDAQAQTRSRRWTCPTDLFRFLNTLYFWVQQTWPRVKPPQGLNILEWKATKGMKVFFSGTVWVNNVRKKHNIWLFNIIIRLSSSNTDFLLSSVFWGSAGSSASCH